VADLTIAQKAGAVALPRELREEIDKTIRELKEFRFLKPSLAPSGNSKVFRRRTLEESREAARLALAAAEYSYLKIRGDGVDFIRQVWFAASAAAKAAGREEELNRARFDARDAVLDKMLAAAGKLGIGKEQASFMAHDMARHAQAKVSLIAVKDLKIEKAEEYLKSLDAALAEARNGYGLAGLVGGVPYLYCTKEFNKTDLPLTKEARELVESKLPQECRDKLARFASFLSGMDYFGAPAPNRGDLSRLGFEPAQTRKEALALSEFLIADDPEWKAADRSAWSAAFSKGRADAMSLVQDAIWQIAFQAVIATGRGSEAEARDVANFMSLKARSITVTDLKFEGKAVFRDRMDKIINALWKGLRVAGTNAGRPVAYCVGEDLSNVKTRA
jgi:hypothetical protein